MNILQFAGFSQSEVDAMMPDVVRILDLGHDIYSVNAADPVVLYDKQGARQGTGKMIIVPGFEALCENPTRLNDLSKKFGVPVTSNFNGRVVLAIGEAIY